MTTREQPADTNAEGKGTPRPDDRWGPLSARRGQWDCDCERFQIQHYPGDFERRTDLLVHSALIAPSQEEQNVPRPSTELLLCCGAGPLLHTRRRPGFQACVSLRK